MTTATANPEQRRPRVRVCGNPGGQDAFLRDWLHRYVAAEGGWMSGKSWAGSAKLMLLHLHNAQRGTRYVPSAALAPTYPNAKDFVIPALLDRCDELKLPAYYKTSDQNIVFPNRPLAPIMVRTADKPERITGWAVGAYWGDEAARWKSNPTNPRYDPLIQIDGRLRHHEARKLQGIFTYTNEGDQTAIYLRFREGRSDHALYRLPTYENPAAREFYREQIQHLTPDLARQYLEGEAVSFGGARAYSMFDEDANVDDSVMLVEGLPIALALDFNIRPGMHGLIGQYDPSADCFNIVHELHRPRLTGRDLVSVEYRRILSEEQAGEATTEVYGDPSGSAAKTTDGKTDYDVVMQAMQALGVDYRVRVRRKDPGVVDRVNAVNVALGDMRGLRHVRIHPRCKRLLTDLRRVKWADDGKGLDKRNPELSHASDALAYWIEYVRPVRARREMPEARVGV